MAQWEKLLRSLGFTDSEAKIYLLSLEMGPTPVQDLAKKAKVSRVTTYTVIETLMKDGLMSTVQKGKKNLYVAESPERLLSFVHGRMRSMEATLREIESSLGDLKLLQRGEKPVVKMFEGKEGVIAIYDDIIKTKPKEIIELSNLDAMRSFMSNVDVKQQRTELDRLKIHSRTIALTSIPVLAPRSNASLTQLPMDRFSFFGNITIYDSKIAFSSFQGKHFSVLIDSEILAQTMRELFRLASEAAEKYKKSGPS